MQLERHGVLGRTRVNAVRLLKPLNALSPWFIYPKRTQPLNAITPKPYIDARRSRCHG